MATKKKASKKGALKRAFKSAGTGLHDDVLHRIKVTLDERLSNESNNHRRCHLVALLFGRPHCPVVRDVILPRIGYWHHRSGDNIDFFSVGFFRDGLATTGETFDDSQFVNAVNSFERRLSWRYSGETDLVLLNAIYFPEYGKVTLDWQEVLYITLEKALDDDAFSSIPRFFEQLIHFAKDYEGARPVWAFSDSLGTKVAGDYLKDFVFSLFPGKLERHVSKAMNLYVKDLTIRPYKRR